MVDYLSDTARQDSFYPVSGNLQYARGVYEAPALVTGDAVMMVSVPKTAAILSVRTCNDILGTTAATIYGVGLYKNKQPNNPPLNGQVVRNFTAIDDDFYSNNRVANVVTTLAEHLFLRDPAGAVDRMWIPLKDIFPVETADVQDVWLGIKIFGTTSATTSPGTLSLYAQYVIQGK